MRLMKNTARGASDAEPSHSAESTVRKMLEGNRSSLEGLDELLREHYTINSNQDILNAVRNGDWVLVTNSSNAAGGGGFFCPMPEPDPVYMLKEEWPAPKKRTDLTFAKSISTAPWGTTHAGTGSEPATNFGKTMIMAASATEVGLGRVAGELILRSFVWSLEMAGMVLKNAAGPVGRVVIMAMTPTMLGDDSFYTEEQLHDMRTATTRVRFQFRNDANGALQVYGIHTSAQSGQDSVPVIHAKWNADKSAMEAHLGGITIIWTPNKGPVVTAPTRYPGVTDELANILVHPISEGDDSKIQGSPIDEFTVEDCIITFPADSGIKSLYLVFAKPMVNPLEVGPANDLSSRSAKDGLDIDHMPSQRALREYVVTLKPGTHPKVLKKILQNAPSIAIPRVAHQKYSETYGGRNTKAKQIMDAADLRAAVDSNLNAIKPYLLDEGFTDEQIETARIDLHNLHQQQGWY